MTRCLPFLLLALTGCVEIVVADDTVTFDGPVDRVVVDVESGAFELVGADVDNVRVERHVEHTAGAEPTLSAELVGGVLTITAECGQKAFGVCTADHRVTLPPDVAADVTTGSGAVVVAGTTGDLTAETGSGAIDVTDVGGAVTLDAGSGAITITGQTGPIDAHTDSGAVEGVDLGAGEIVVETGSGSVDLRVVGAITSASAESGSGNVALRVPAGAYALDLTTGSGEVTTEGVTDDAGAAPIRAHAGSGDVSVVGE